MNLTGARGVWTVTGFAVCLFAQSLRTMAADPSTHPPPASDATNVVSRQPVKESPVEVFRKLLAMTSAERDRFLTIYPPQIKTRILQKIQEYQLMPPEFREVKLRVTELCGYLLPLMKEPSTNRQAQLQSIPEPYREMVATRLAQWDLMPPSLKDEVLEYETTMQYFVGRSAVVQPQTSPTDVPENERPTLEQKLARWRALPLTERQQMYESFEHFVSLSDAEKAKTLETLSTSERRQTEKNLGPIDKWPKAQQEKYMAAFRTFANMTPAERQQFMVGAERWQKMSPEERQAWRDLVRRVSDARLYPIGFHPSPVSAPLATNKD